MDDIRKMVEDVCREDDASRRDFELWEWRRAQRAKRSAPADIVRKTYEPKPAPQQPAAVMDAQTQAAWDRWVKNHIAIALEAHRKMLVKAIGRAMSEYVHKRLDAEAAKLREEIGQLRADLTLARALMKGEISEIVRKDNRDVA